MQRAYRGPYPCRPPISCDCRCRQPSVAVRAPTLRSSITLMLCYVSTIYQSHTWNTPAQFGSRPCLQRRKRSLPLALRPIVAKDGRRWDARVPRRQSPAPTDMCTQLTATASLGASAGTAASVASSEGHRERRDAQSNASMANYSTLNCARACGCFARGRDVACACLAKCTATETHGQQCGSRNSATEARQTCSRLADAQQCLAGGGEQRGRGQAEKVVQNTMREQGAGNAPSASSSSDKSL